MPKISVCHKSVWGSRLGVMEIFLNERSIGYVPNKETKEFDVPAGQHRLMAKTGFYRSKAFSFTMFNNDTKKITVYPNQIFFTFIFPFIILCIVSIEGFFPKDIVNVSSYCYRLSPLILFLIPALIIKIWKNRLLIIKEGSNT